MSIKLRGGLFFLNLHLVFFTYFIDIRQREEKILYKAAFMQSISWTGSPVLATIAPMTTFIGMVLTGVKLVSSQV